MNVKNIIAATAKNGAYFLWSSAHYLDRDRDCPACGNNGYAVVDRKAIVTLLLECSSCGLRYRFPKGDVESDFAFYQNRYSEGFTTRCPSDTELDYLIQTRFSDTDKDFTAYIGVLKAMGLNEGATVLDFGSSWGYGSWQMRQAGYDVYSYEISGPRAQYARDKLACKVVTESDLNDLNADAIFSSHVIEHLSDPNILWRIAKNVLNDNGRIILTTPNGDDEVKQIIGSQRYHQHWGRVHPLLFTTRALEKIASRYGFRCRVYASSYPYVFPLDAITKMAEKVQLGAELLLVGERV